MPKHKRAEFHGDFVLWPDEPLGMPRPVKDWQVPATDLFEIAHGHNLWQELRDAVGPGDFQIAIDSADLRSRYQCPWTNLWFYGTIPIAVSWAVQDQIPWRDGANVEQRAIETIANYHHEDEITRAIQGHGYTDEWLPNDGSGQWSIVSAEIKDHESLRTIWFRTLEWFNK